MTIGAHICTNKVTEKMAWAAIVDNVNTTRAIQIFNNSENAHNSEKK